MGISQQAGPGSSRAESIHMRSIRTGAIPYELGCVGRLQGRHDGTMYRLAICALGGPSSARPADQQLTTPLGVAALRRGPRGVDTLATHLSGRCIDALVSGRDRVPPVGPSSLLRIASYTISIFPLRVIPCSLRARMYISNIKPGGHDEVRAQSRQQMGVRERFKRD